MTGAVRDSASNGWHVFHGNGIPHEGIRNLPAPPRWRPSHELESAEEEATGDTGNLKYDAAAEVILEIEPDEVELVNAAIYLRRPLLVTGHPGLGKSSLAAAIAYELGLGEVLRWSITTRSTLQDGLYQYDAIDWARASVSSPGETTSSGIGDYITLGPLGTAFLPGRVPRVLLVDEIDKSDIDLPNDLLHVFETGVFEVRELKRLKAEVVDVRPHGGRLPSSRVRIRNGTVRCHAFPIVVLTSNGERDFPPAFLRRCIRLDIKPPSEEKLERIVRQHLGDDGVARAKGFITKFIGKKAGELATDQLLNAIYLAAHHNDLGKTELVDHILRSLTHGPSK